MGTIDQHQLELIRILGNQSNHEIREVPELTQHELSGEGFSVPGLLLIAFQEILGLKPYGPFEKMAWLFRLEYQGLPIVVSLEKSGLRLTCPNGMDKERVIQALKKCCQVAEKHLKPTIETSFHNAEVTLENQYHKFNDAYEFFRRSAHNAFQSPPPEPIITKTSMSWRPFEPMIHGGYFASAMLDAYFSKLEHTLVLMAPFTKINLKNGELQRLVGMAWGDKFKLLFDLSNDLLAKRNFDSLVQVKEEFRNKNSHGGFLKKGASFYVHTPAGALPAQLTRFNHDWMLRVTSVPEMSYEKMCGILDNSDKFLQACHLADAYRYVTSGLPISVDDVTRSKYHEAIDSGLLDVFMANVASRYDQHMNMDY